MSARASVTGWGGGGRAYTVVLEVAGELHCTRHGIPRRKEEEEDDDQIKGNQGIGSAAGMNDAAKLKQQRPPRVGAISGRVAEGHPSLYLALPLSPHPPHQPHVTTEYSTSALGAGHVDEAAGQSECEGGGRAEEECGGIAG